ncbi:interference hedgehog-like isoform X2 [Nylanderia fulva]|uniref:interference hedgehog-like isoform X2 n=2 Tax=Nylanderia fulva TaxID=613905 RepID=UPI0010FAF8FE|nr:interference hedgehog-like isoform X2 [Nylanderia fulva]
MTSIFPLRGIIVILLYGPIAYICGQKQELKKGSDFYFNRHPQPLAAPLNDDVNFECSVAVPADKFAWHHRPLNSNKWIPLSQNSTSSKTLSRYIVNFDNESKAGDYRCIAFFGPSGLVSDPAKLTLATMQKFSDKNDVIIQVAEGNTVPITCPVPYCEPEAIVQFYKNGVLIKNADLVNSKTMIIKNVRSTDSGFYSCSANNYITQQIFESNYKTVLTVSANTTVKGPTFIKQLQSEYIVMKNKNITLECFAAGYPVPRITWSRLGSSLPLKSIKSPTGLTIISAQLSDRGEYHCVWDNTIQQIKSVFILRVVDSPKVTKAPKGGFFSEGSELEFSCNVTGEPEPSVEWLINGKSLKSNKNQEIKGSTLLLSEVQKKHAGIVQCVASNEYGSHSGHNLLIVNPRQHDSEMMSRHKHTRGGRRRNKEGRKKGAVLVPPTQPNVTRLSDISVMVRWSVPENNGLPIQFFKVQYRELGPKMIGKQAKWMTANSEIPNHVRSFEVTDLQSDHTYRFRIAAVYSNNDNKLSPNSIRFHLNNTGGTESDKMPIPLLTNTEALGPHQVLLMWQNSDKSVKIDGFYIYHRPSTTAGEYLKTTVEGKDAYNMTICHLQSETVYEFKIQSFSVDAASEFSQILRQKTGKSIEEHPVQQVIAENKVKPKISSENIKSVNIHVIIGGVFGGAVILVALAFAAGCLYKRVKYKQNQESQSEGKPITNGRVMNGGVTDSKINITSNPLAGLDTSEDMQPKIKHWSRAAL